MSLLDEFGKVFTGVAAGMAQIKKTVDDASKAADSIEGAIPSPEFQTIKTALTRKLVAKGATNAATIVAVEGEAIVQAVAETLREIKEAMENPPDPE